MGALTDPSMKEMVDEFTIENEKLLDELEQILDQFEESLEVAWLEKFGQTIDRIMGAAKCLQAETIGKYCELGKLIGYKASQVKEAKLLEIVAAILFDTIDLLRQMNENIVDGKGEDIEGLSTEAFATRMKWLSEKFKNIKRSSVKLEGPAAAAKPAKKLAIVEDEEEFDDDEDLDDLLDDLGI